MLQTVESVKDVVIKYEPHTGQKAFHESKAKFRAIITGIGFGKSAAGVNEMIQEVVTHPGTLNLIFAPTFPMLKNATMREFFKFCPAELIVKHNMSDHIVTVRTISGETAEIIYLSGDNERNIDRIRGLTLGSAYEDEISISPRYVWDIIVGRLRDPRGSMRSWVSTTPKGSRHWIHELFIEKKVGNKDDYEMFGGSTLDNPYTPQEYKDSLLSTYTGVFREQELYGKFVGFEGLVYPTFNRSIHVIDTKGMGFKDIVGGVDFGFTNPSVILKLGIDSDNRYYIIDEFYEKQVTDSALADVGKDKFDDTSKIIADSENPSGIREFRNRGLNCVGVSKKPGERHEGFIMSGIKHVSNLLEIQPDGKPRIFVDKRCVNTIMEFENYRYAEKREDRNPDEVPIKIHDHAMDVVRYVILTLEGKPSVFWGGVGAKK